MPAGDAKTAPLPALAASGIGAVVLAMLQPLALLAGATAAAGTAMAEPERRNWFDDPFFQVSAEIADCPLPAGPFITKAERRVQAHHRAEKGTTCWLAGLCDQPSSYADDAGIAEAFKVAWAAQAALAPATLTRSTLWVTVQGRVVYIEGCVAEPGAEAALETLARGLPKVQQAMAIVRTRPDQAPPYKRRDAD